MKIIPLSQNRYATIDDEDYELIQQHRWYFHDRYTKTNVRVPGTPRRYKSVSMHRLIMNAPPGVQVDHRDGNGLNNTRTNLRFATPAQNARNRAACRKNACGFKGVAGIETEGKWAATIHKNGRNIQLGKRSTPQDAARLYNAAAILLYGDFARLNNVPSPTWHDLEIAKKRLQDGQNMNVNNTSGYRGVRWFERDKNWVAQIHPQHTGITIGYFEDKEEAAYVYDQFALQLMGDKAKLNLM